MRWLVLVLPLCCACVRAGFSVARDGARASDGAKTGDGAGDAQAPLQPLAATWCHTFGSPGSDRSWGVAVGPGGEIYVTGHFSQTVDFGGPTLKSTGGSDVLLLSLTPDGAYRWAENLGGVGNDEGWGLAVDGEGNVYLAAHFNGTAVIGSDNLTSKGDADLLISSFTSAGTHRWSVRGGGAGEDWARAVALDGQGNLFVIGHITGQAEIAGTALPGAGVTDVFLTSFTTGGTHRWSKRFGGPGADRGRTIAVDQGGNVIIGGHFEGTADFGGSTPLVSAGATDVFLASFTPAGGYRWSRPYGGPGDDWGMSVAVDRPRELLVLTGSFASSIKLGQTTLSSKGAGDIFWARFSAAAGEPVLAGSLGAGEEDWGTTLALDASGRALVGGHFRGSAGDLVGLGGDDALICRTSSQNARCAAIAGAGEDEIMGVAVDGAGRIVVAGTYSAELKAGPCTATNRGGLDLFVASYR